MTAMLASVTDAAEAAMALRLGAEVIDLKDPAAGALGALPLPAIAALTAAVGGRRLVSATIGDLPMVPALLLRAVRDTAGTGVDFVKAGLFAQAGRRRCIAALAAVSRDTRLVGVLFADQKFDLALLDALADAGFAGVMLDTADKRAGGLRRHRSDGELAAFVERAGTLGLVSGLAGSLGLEDIAPLTALAPTYLGFRGALCANRARTGGLDPDSFAAVRACVSSARSTPRGERQVLPFA